MNRNQSRCHRVEEKRDGKEKEKEKEGKTRQDDEEEKREEVKDKFNLPGRED